MFLAVLSPLYNGKKNPTKTRVSCPPTESPALLSVQSIARALDSRKSVYAFLCSVLPCFVYSYFPFFFFRFITIFCVVLVS